MTAARIAIILALSVTAAPSQVGKLLEARQRPRIDPAVLLVGTWINEGHFGTVTWRFSEDHRWARWVPRRREPEQGRWTLRGEDLELHGDDGRRRQLKAKIGAEGIVLAEVGSFQVLRRESREPYDNSPLEPDLEQLRPSPSGHILFTRYSTSRDPKNPIPLPAIWIMTGDGAAAAPFIDPREGWQVMQPRWSPDGRHMVFASNFEMGRSAYYTDIFEASCETAGVRRVTGSERSWERKPGRAFYMSLIQWQVDQPVDALKKVKFTFQGADGKPYYPKKSSKLSERFDVKLMHDTVQSFIALNDIPAGRFWVKIWVDKHLGDLMVLDLADDEKRIAFDQPWLLSRGNRLATEPSISPDGRRVAGLLQHAWYTKGPDPRRNPDPQPHKGFDTIAIFDAIEGAEPIGVWNLTQADGQNAKDPVLSPDGRHLAFALGLATRESIAICSVDELCGGRSRAQVVAAGQLHPGRGSIGHGDPAWSPDGRRLAFVRLLFDLGGNFRGDLYVVAADGSGLTQLTQLGPNEVPACPSWSPDGRSIAFQRITAKRDAMNFSDMVTLNVRSDIWKVASGGGSLQRLTQDGISAEPSWGP